MKLAVLHHHFQPGGVSQVVRTHLQALACQPMQHRPREVLLIGGRQPTTPLPFEVPRQFPVAHRWCQALDYAFPHAVAPDHIDSSPDAAEALAGAIVQLLQQAGFDPADSVLHWHNPTVGKNAAIPGAVARLAASGWRMLLQIHDFAEDFRPQNYAYLINALTAADPRELESKLYPQAATIHYASLTEHDRGHLRALGMLDERVHVLPNAAWVPSQAHEQRAAPRAALQRLGLPTAARLFVYPVRGIRRKNVGELLLLAALTSPDVWLAITLPPTTAIERQSYERWRRVAESLQLRVRFDLGLHARNSLADNLAASEAVISTSVAEGFGMVFLEPWLADRPLIARDLPTVTSDLRRGGLQLEHLYRSLPVPLGSESAAAMVEITAAWRRAWRSLPLAFRPPYAPPIAADAADGELDFAALTPPRQEAVLRRAASDAGFAAAVRKTCAATLAWLDEGVGSAPTAANAATVRHAYGPEPQGRQLSAVYASLLRCPPSRGVQPPPAAGALWTRFTGGEEYRPCRTELPSDAPTPTTAPADV